MSDREESVESIALRQYEIIRRIFNCLPMGDVKRASSVCKLWYEVSNLTRAEQARMKPQVFCWRAPPRASGFYKDYQYPHSPDHKDFAEKFSTFISNLWIDPEIALILSTGDPSDILSEEFKRDENGFLYSLPGFHLDPLTVDRSLPKSCTSLSLTMSGVVLTLENNEVLEMENIENPPEFEIGVSVAFLPRCSGTKMIPFIVSEAKQYLLADIDDIKEGRPNLSSNEIYNELLYKTCGHRLTPQEKISCFLALTNNHEYPYTTRLIKTIGAKMNRDVAIGGAVGHLARCSSDRESLETLLDDFVQHEVAGCEDYLKTVGILITGDRVQAASIVLNRTIKSVGKIQTELSKLKACGLAENKSVAFMFACCARGRYFHKSNNVESKVFRTLFPNVPLVGAFCGGEIGFNCLRNQPPTMEEELLAAMGSKKPKVEPPAIKEREICHSFTTVFVLISF